MNVDFKAALSGEMDYFKEKHNNKEVWLLNSHPKSGDTVVHIASRNNHASLLQFFVEQGANLELANFDGKRALHEAAQGSCRESLEFLLKSEVKIDPLKRADWTPLMLACTKDDLVIVERLLDCRANPQLRNKDGWNSFHVAVREGHLPIIELLLEKHGTLWDTVSKNGRTPLHTAALHGHSGMISFLLDHCGYQPDMKDSCGSTPLMDALRVDSILSAEVLLSKHKAYIGAEDNLGRQAIHLAAQAGAMKSQKYLVENCHVSPNTRSTGTQLTPLHCAAKEDQVEALKYLLLCEADVNACDNKGRSALHIASGAQHPACVGALLGSGADCNPDMSGTLPQHLARKQPVIDIFLQRGIT